MTTSNLVKETVFLGAIKSISGLSNQINIVSAYCIEHAALHGNTEPVKQLFAATDLNGKRAFFLKSGHLTQAGKDLRDFLNAHYQGFKVGFAKETLEVTVALQKKISGVQKNFCVDLLATREALELDPKAATIFSSVAIKEEGAILLDFADFKDYTKPKKEKVEQPLTLEAIAKVLLKLQEKIEQVGIAANVDELKNGFNVAQVLDGVIAAKLADARVQAVAALDELADTLKAQNLSSATAQEKAKLKAIKPKKAIIAKVS